MNAATTAISETALTEFEQKMFFSEPTTILEDHYNEFDRSGLESALRKSV